MMNKTILFSLVVAAIMSVRCTQTDTTPKTDSTNKSEEASSSKLRLAYVQIDTLLSQYQLAQDLNKSLLSKEENARAALNKDSKDLQAQVEEFQRKLQNNGFASEDRARSEQIRLQGLQERLQEKSDRLSQELETAAKLNTQRMRDSVKNFMKKYSKEKGYNMVISNTGMETLLYADSSFDITAAVIKGLNVRYKTDAPVKK